MVKERIAVMMGVKKVIIINHVFPCPRKVSLILEISLYSVDSQLRLYAHEVDDRVMFLDHDL